VVENLNPFLSKSLALSGSVTATPLSSNTSLTIGYNTFDAKLPKPMNEAVGLEPFFTTCAGAPPLISISDTMLLSFRYFS